MHMEAGKLLAKSWKFPSVWRLTLVCNPYDTDVKLPRVHKHAQTHTPAHPYAHTRLPIKHSSKGVWGNERQSTMNYGSYSNG